MADKKRREPPRARQKRGDDQIISDEETNVRTIAGTVAVVGYPNVGKSTLINRLSGRRETVVHEQPGVTRDRKELEAEWNGKIIKLIDTGGIDEIEGGRYAKDIIEQAKMGIAEADLVLFVVDAQTGAGPGDEEVADLLRRSSVPVILVANKADNPAKPYQIHELHRLGFGEPIAVSASHGTSSGDLLDRICDELGEVEGAAHEEQGSEEIRVTILGRPNVGKSSLFNALLGAPRAIVSDVPGTTRDTVDTTLVRDETIFRLIDTAGMRRKRKHRQDIEYWSERRALDAAARADVALVLVDASEGITDQDLSVADEARKAGAATIVVVSKWDINEIDLDMLRRRIEDKLRQRPPVITTSSVTGRGLERVLNTIEEVHARYTSRMATPKVNRLLKDAVERRQPPIVHGKRLKLIYGAQVQTRPPRFRITVNDRKLITRDYAYFIENRIREGCGLEGVPVIVDFVAR